MKKNRIISVDDSFRHDDDDEELCIENNTHKRMCELKCDIYIVDTWTDLFFS